MLNALTKCFKPMIAAESGQVVDVDRWLVSVRWDCRSVALASQSLVDSAKQDSRQSNCRSVADRKLWTPEVWPLCCKGRNIVLTGAFA